VTQGKQAWPTRAVARRVREVRVKRGLSGGKLADRMTALGIRWDRSIVANLESGRRGQLSVDELLALAAALNVAPVHLLVAPEDYDAPYEVTPEVTYSASGVRAWIRGIHPLGDDGDPREFFAEVPRQEFYAVQQGPPRKPDEPYGVPPAGYLPEDEADGQG
jgi:transcriptional regulator with XRE-family HTH domain